MAGPEGKKDAGNQNTITKKPASISPAHPSEKEEGGRVLTLLTTEPEQKLLLPLETAGRPATLPSSIHKEDLKKEREPASKLSKPAPCPLTRRRTWLIAFRALAVDAVSGIRNWGGCSRFVDLSPGGHEVGDPPPPARLTFVATPL